MRDCMDHFCLCVWGQIFHCDNIVTNKDLTPHTDVKRKNEEIYLHHIFADTIYL
jgi:hypothetical protein